MSKPVKSPALRPKLMLFGNPRGDFCTASPFCPMRLLILSELHLEFASFETPDPATYDIAVLAGDIWSGPKAVRWAQRESTFAGRPVVLVPGNHEFYGSERTRTLELMREAAAGSNVHLLDRDEVTLMGIRLVITLQGEHRE